MLRSGAVGAQRSCGARHATSKVSSGAAGPPKSSRRGPAAGRTGEQPLRLAACRNSLSVGRLTSTAACARQARKAPNPTSQAVTARRPHGPAPARRPATRRTRVSPPVRAGPGGGRASRGRPRTAPVDEDDRPVGRWSRLSLRMSQCTRCSAGSSASAAHLRAEVAARSAQPPGHQVRGEVGQVGEASRPPPQVVAQVDQAAAVGVRAPAAAARARASPGQLVGRGEQPRHRRVVVRGRGGRPRRPRAAARPSRRRRTTPAGPPRAGASPSRRSRPTSRRKSAGVSGLSSVPTALTKARVPSAQTTRVAHPGDMPPTCSARGDDGRAERVVDPGAHRAPASRRTARGRRPPAAPLTASPGARTASPSTPRPASAGLADVRRGRRHRVVG